MIKAFIFTGALLLAWLIFAQNFMRMRLSDREAKQKFKEKGIQLHTQILSLNGRSLHYAATGSDSLPTIFFIHGSPGSWDAFIEFLKDKELLRHFRLVSVDRPGFGFSDFGKARPLQEQSGIISPLFEYLKNGQAAYIVGHSLGGPMAVKLAADNPGRFAGMLLLAASISAKEEEPETWRPTLMKTPLRYLVPGALSPSNDELWYLKTDLIKLENEFSAIKMPVTMIHGTADKLVPVGNTEFAKRVFTAAPLDIILLPGGDHFIPFNRFDIVKQTILKWTEKQ